MASIAASKPAAASDSEDESGDESDENEPECPLQVGFVEAVGETPMFEDLNWNNWDGGRIGGKPFWLNKSNLPSPQRMQCTHCKEQLSFILQVYCPLDDITGAFHRMIYLFCCRQPSCAKKGSMMVLRCQLPQKNEFYAEIAQVSCETNMVDKFPNTPHLCAVCGFKGPLACSACKKAYYCCKSHQKMAWKAQHKQACRGTGTARSNDSRRHHYGCLFPSYEIEVCELDDDEEEANISEVGTGGEDIPLPSVKMQQEAAHRAEAEATLEKLKHAKVGGDKLQETAQEMAEMATMRQKDIVAREGVESSAMRDTTTFNFMLQVAAAKNQVLRYQRWCSKPKHGPLWIKSDATIDAPPRCRCGAPRKFEFQVMPQLVHFLLKESSNMEVKAQTTASEDDKNMEKLKLISAETLDWGVLAVYTCTASCNSEEKELGAYMEEFLWRQPPL